MYAKYSKGEFWLRLVSFPGHIISIEGVEVDPRKTEAMKKLRRPLTPIIRSFLTLAGYYRRFMDVFTSIASSFTTLTLKSKSLNGLRHVRRASNC